MDYTTIQNAATKIVDNIKVIDGNISALQNKQDIISTSDMSMMNSHEGKLKIEEIGGKCEQFTTTGKNLLPISEYATNASGGTFKYMDVPAVETGKNYILSGKTTDGIALTGGNAQAFFHDSEGKILDGTAEWFTKGFVVNIDLSSATKFEVYTSESLAGKTIQIQLEEGSVVTEWEPYTGGQPSPNPDYPQEIKKTVVSEIKTHGKNCLNCSGLTEQTINGLTFTPKYDTNGNLDYVEVNGISTAHTEYSVANSNTLAGIDSGVDYILSGCPNNGSTSTYCMVYLEWDSNWGEISRFTDVGTEINIVHNDNASFMSIRITIAGGQTVNKLRFYPMIRKADIEDDVYEPYTESTIKLSQPVELYGIGDVQDTIDVEKGEVIRRIGFYTSTFAEVQNSLTYSKELRSPKPASMLRKTYICSKAVYAAPNGYTWDIDKIGICGIAGYDGEQLSLRVDINSPSLTADIAYQWATPKVEPLPAADQIALNNLSTYDTITYLEFDSEIEPTFKGEYGVTGIGGHVLEDLITGLNSELSAQSDADRIAALESTIVNNIQD